MKWNSPLFRGSAQIKISLKLPIVIHSAARKTRKPVAHARVRARRQRHSRGRCLRMYQPDLISDSSPLRDESRFCWPILATSISEKTLPQLPVYSWSGGRHDALRNNPLPSKIVTQRCSIQRTCRIRGPQKPYRIHPTPQIWTQTP